MITYICEIIFYLSITYISLAYFLYPIYISCIAFIKKKIVWSENNESPSVAFVISVYNEEKVIKKKINNTLELSYPNTQLHIYIISDASNDKTNSIVQQYRNDYKNIHFHNLSERVGKNGGLNYIFEFIQQDIIVFSDANSYYKEDALLHLIRPFNNDKIGCVIGDVCFTNVKKRDISTSEYKYWELEKFIKSSESKIGKVIIGNGAIIAIRKKLFNEIPPDVANDLFLPVIIRSHGYYVVYNNNAIAYENISTSDYEEYQRKIRIITRGITAIITLFSKIKFSTWLQLFFRKAIRWFVGFSLVTLFISNLFLIKTSIVYLLIFLIQVMFYSLAVLFKLGVKSKLGSYAFYYCLVNYAGIRGIINGFLRRRIRMWDIPSSTR